MLRQSSRPAGNPFHPLEVRRRTCQDPTPQRSLNGSHVCLQQAGRRVGTRMAEKHQNGASFTLGIRLLVQI